MPLTLDNIIAQVAAFPLPPAAFEAMWDGDTQGWFLTLSAIVPQEDRYQTIFLCVLQDGGDIRLFNNHVPPWSEAEQARQWGAALGAQFDVPFYFPSPDHPEDDCPHWWEREQAVLCSRCDIPLLQRDLCPWRGVCYYCHLDEEREQREATWTAAERAGPRCHICGNPAPGAMDTAPQCDRCQERYYRYQCRSCHVTVMQLRSTIDTLDDLCPRCSIRDRLASVPVHQQDAIRNTRATQSEFATVDLVQDLLGWSFDDALEAVRFLQQGPAGVSDIPPSNDPG